MNDRVDKLDDGDSCEIEATVERVVPPTEGKRAYRVKLVGDPRTYYTMRAMQLVNPGDHVSLTIKGSEYQGSIFLWIADWMRVQREELPLERPETREGMTVQDGVPE